MHSSQSPQLSQKERRLHDYLLAEWPRLAPKFYGAIYTLSDPNNPERKCQVAHSLREIMSEIENFYTKRHIELGKRLKQLLAALDPHREKANSFHGLTSSTAAELEAVMHYIASNEDFLHEYEEEQITLNKRVEALLFELDPSLHVSQAGWRVGFVKEWRELKHMLVKVAHGSLMSDGDFTQLKDRWVSFLVDRTRPLTTEHQATILDMINAVEDQT